MPSRAGGPGVCDASWRRAHSHTQCPSPASLEPTPGRGAHLPGREGATRNRKMPPKLWHRGAGHGSWTMWENKKGLGRRGPQAPERQDMSSGTSRRKPAASISRKPCRGPDVTADFPRKSQPSPGAKAPRLGKSLTVGFSKQPLALAPKRIKAGSPGLQAAAARLPEGEHSPRSEPCRRP